MPPKLVSAIQTAFTPKKWFKERPELTCEATAVEERQDPVPGIYKHVQGRGWFLAAYITYKGEEKNFETCTPPMRVTYSKVLHRYFFDDDYQARKTYGRFIDGQPKQGEIGFFRVDDVAWVNCWDQEGNFLQGPYRRYVPDQRTKKFRPMTRIDDPEYLKKKTARLSGGSNGQSQTQTQGTSLGVPDASQQPEFDRSLTGGSSSTTSTAYTNKLWVVDAAARKSTQSNRPSEDSGYQTKLGPS